MASFTDQISQFNPYIQQLPVEAMTQVGMYKQQKYDEGVQKIQGYVDNIAGLDVYKDIDKVYLQSKLNELGSKLKTVAAGDFSNQQLVNSVGGMATQIVKDPNVQNAAFSTKKYRKGIEEMEAAIKEGKSSQANIYDFNNKASSWLNSNDLGQAFNDRYTQYIDVGKKAMDAIKALHPKLRQYDIPFEIDEKTGAINKNVVANALKRYKIEGISEDQIEQAIRASLSPDDVNQLQIDANYRFRDIAPDSLVKVSMANYSASKKNAIETLDYLKGQLDIVSDPTERDKIGNRIEYYETLLGKDGIKGILDEQLEDNIKNAKENPDSVKLSIYKDGFVKEYANAFSWKNTIESYEDSPLRKQLNWVEDMNLKLEQEKRQRYEFKITSGQRAEEIQISRDRLTAEQEENALKKLELFGDSGGQWTPLTNPTDTKLRAKDYYADHTTSVKNDIEGDLALLGTRYSPRQIDEMLQDWQKNGKKATKVQPDAIEILERLSKNQNYLQGLIEKDESINKEARQEVLNNPKNIKTSQELTSNIKRLDSTVSPVRVNFGGQEVTLTPSQLIKDIQEGKAKLVIDRAPLGYMRVSYNVNGKMQTFEIPKRSSGVQNVLAPELRPLLAGVGEHFEKYGSFEKDIKKAVDEKYLEKLSPLISDIVPEVKAVARNKEGKIPSLLFDKIKQLTIAVSTGGYQANNDYSEEATNSMLSDENIKDTNIFIHRKGDDYEVRLRNTKLDKPAQVFKLKANDVVKYFGRDYVSDKTQESVRIGIGNGNTNLTGNPQRSLMQQAFGDFPGINKLTVTADLRSTLANKDLYNPYINVRKKNGRYETFIIKGAGGRQTLGYDQAKQSLNILTDENLLKLLKEHYPNYDFSQLDY